MTTRTPNTHEMCIGRVYVTWIAYWTLTAITAVVTVGAAVGAVT